MTKGNRMAKSIFKEAIEWVLIIAAAVAVAYLIDHFLIVNATVPSSSMEKTIMTGDRVIGNRLAYLKSDPQRGDIVIFKFPDDEKVLYIKRVIGLPGETLEVKDGHVYINGAVLDEPYLNVTTDGRFGPYRIPEGGNFMKGDNRNDSADSRYWHNTYLYRDGMVGKAVFRYWPSFSRLE